MHCACADAPVPVPGVTLIDLGEHMLKDNVGTHNLLQVMVPGLEDRHVDAALRIVELSLIMRHMQGLDAASPAYYPDPPRWIGFPDAASCQHSAGLMLWAATGFFEAPGASACLFSMTQTEPLPLITLVFCAIQGLNAMKVWPAS